MRFPFFLFLEVSMRCVNHRIICILFPKKIARFRMFKTLLYRALCLSFKLSYITEYFTNLHKRFKLLENWDIFSFVFIVKWIQLRIDCKHTVNIFEKSHEHSTHFFGWDLYEYKTIHILQTIKLTGIGSALCVVVVIAGKGIGDESSTLGCFFVYLSSC